MTTDIVRFKDFTPDADDPPNFKVHGVHYWCLPDIPLDSLAELSAINEDEDSTTAQKSVKMMEFLASCLAEHSATVFLENTQKGSQTPIGVKTIQQLVPWMMEQYGLRPTQESSESSDGSTDDDGSSTGGV